MESQRYCRDAVTRWVSVIRNQMPRHGILIAAICLLLALVVSASGNTHEKKLPYVKVVSENGVQTTGKVLYVTDSVLVLWQSEELYDERSSDEFATPFSFSEINEVCIRGKGSLGKNVLTGMGYGILIGGGFGAIVGLASGDDKVGFIRYCAEAKAGMGFVAFAIPGAVIGGIAGAGKKTTHWYFIGGNIKAYQEVVPRLNKVAILPDRASTEMLQGSCNEEMK